MNPGLSMPQGLAVMPPGLATINVGRMLALPGFGSRQIKIENNPPVKVEQLIDDLSVNAEQLIDNVLRILNKLVVQAIETRTAEEFLETRNRVFPQYFEAVLGLSHLIQLIVPKDVLEGMSNESFSKIEASFRDRGLMAFGSDVRDQAVFTTWTLRKISNICQRIDAIPLESDLKANDFVLFGQFLYHAMCTRFSLDCLSKSMLLQKPVYPDVLPIIINELRSVVNAYAYVRHALDLREPAPELPVSSADWDDEEQQLLDEASYDIMEMIE